jgi:hypothetical protein
MPGPALLVMAAGLGSRYGGLKQIAGVGPADELLLEYAVFDAHRAGFARVIFVIRPDLTEQFDALVARLPGDLGVDIAIQPASARAGEGPVLTRAKPWGTVHAVLSARASLSTPFAIVNADDFYGAEAYQLAAHACREAAITGDYALIGMRLDRTLSASGPVARGVCVTQHEQLIWLDEVREIERTSTGIHGRFPDGTRALTGAEIASMNCWAFTPAVLPALEAVFDEFLRQRGHDERAESPLPEAVNVLVQAKTARVRVLETPGPWFGLTHPGDHPKVVEGLRELTARGIYPSPLWRK